MSLEKDNQSIPTTPKRRTNNDSPPNIKRNWKQSKENHDNILAYWVPKDSIKAKRREALKENRSVSLNLCRSEDRLGGGYKFMTPPGTSLLGKRKRESIGEHRTKIRRNAKVKVTKLF